MRLPIVKYGDPVLETPCQPVPESEFGTPELRTLVSDMFETMYAAAGVGLAAPQVGISRRLTVIDHTGGEEKGTKLVLVNPRILGGEGEQTGEEGCLSIPGFRENVTRPATVQVHAYNVDGEELNLESDELLARVICHECDPVDGVLFREHISRFKREWIKRKIRNLKKRGEWD